MDSCSGALQMIMCIWSFIISFNLQILYQVSPIIKDIDAFMVFITFLRCRIYLQCFGIVYRCRSLRTACYWKYITSSHHLNWLIVLVGRCWARGWCSSHCSSYFLQLLVPSLQKQNEVGKSINSWPALELNMNNGKIV